MTRLNGLRNALMAAATLLAGAAQAGPDDIALPGKAVFPESLTSTREGTLYVGNLGEGGVIRVKDGKPEVWLKPGAFGTGATLGVFADEASDTLWVCSNDLSAMGLPNPGQPGHALAGFDLRTGEGKVRAPFPTGAGAAGVCNDIAVGPDGAAYISDSSNPRILRLAKGAKTVEVWSQDPRFKVAEEGNVDGIAFGADGNLYVTTIGASHLFRVELDGNKPGRITEIALSRPFMAADGMRHERGTTFLTVEADAGRLSRIEVVGDAATVTTVGEGFEGPTSLAIAGDAVWVSEGQLDVLFDPAKRAKGPALPFRLRAAPLGH